MQLVVFGLVIVQILVFLNLIMRGTIFNFFSVLVYYFPDNTLLLAEKSFSFEFSHCKDVFLILRLQMAQFKGKELIRCLAWFVYQDQENY